MDYMKANLAYSHLEAPNTRNGNPRRLYMMNFASDVSAEQEMFVHVEDFTGTPHIIRCKAYGSIQHLPTVQITAKVFRDLVRVAKDHGRFLPAILATGKEA